MITFADLNRHVFSALHSDPEDVSVREIINTAGRALVNAHSWEWLDGAEATLTMGASVSRVALPADFRSDAEVSLTSTVFQHIRRVTPRELQRIRQESVVQYMTHTLLWSLSTQPDDKGVPRPYLEYWPESTTAIPDAIHIVYARDWGELTDDNQVVQVPGFIEPVLIQAVRAVASGWEDDEEGDVDQRLSIVFASRLFRDAVNRDSEGQLVIDPPPVRPHGTMPNFEQGYRFGDYEGVV